MSITLEIGQRIRFYRKNKHLSQETLAERSGTHPTYIGQIERGEKNATIEVLYKITRALEISMSQLFENIEMSECPAENNIALQIYYQIMDLPEEKQKMLQRIIHDICKFTE